MKLKPLRRVVLLAGVLALFTANIFGQCPAPTNLQATNLTPTSAYFVWSNSLNSTEYVIKLRPSGTSTWRRITSVNNSETVTGLLPNTSYVAKIRSDCSGIEGAYSGYYYFSTPSNSLCGAPNVYYFTSNNITANSCKVGWPSVSGSTGYNVRYKVRYSSDPWDIVQATTNYVTLNSLDPHTLYEFQVQVVCGAGTGSFTSSGIFTTLNVQCTAPTGLAANNVTDSTAVLSWSTVPCASYYRIEYRPLGQSWSIDTTSANSFNLTQLSSGTPYDFRVQSVLNSGNTSSYSPIFAFATSTGNCGTPIGLSASGIITDGATYSWDPVAGALSYNLRYRLAGAAVWVLHSIPATFTAASVAGLSSDNAYEFQIQSVCAGGAGSWSAPYSFITPQLSASGIPVPDHIVVCILENKAYTQLMGSSLTPRINALSNDPKSAVFLESYGITHPSQPNYLHLFSGTNQGVSNNVTPSQSFNTPNLARELLNANRTFVTYSQGLPSTGYNGSSSGKYVRKHNPVANWMGSGSNQIPATLNQPLTAFPTNFNNLPTVSFVIPDLDNSMHDGSLGTALALGDAWFYNTFNAYIQWAKTNNSLFILTTDEDDGSHSNRILTILTGEMVEGGDYMQPINHHSVLRTICEMYGLNFIGGANNANPLQGCWTNGFRKAAGDPVPTQLTTEKLEGWKIYPNPSKGEVHLGYELTSEEEVTIRMYSSTGQLIHDKKMGRTSKGHHVYDFPKDLNLSTGVYIVAVTYGEKKYVQRFLVSE